MVTGDDRPAGGTMRRLCVLPPEPDGKPEGITVVSQSGAAMDVILVYDANKRLIARRGKVTLN